MKKLCLRERLDKLARKQAAQKKAEKKRQSGDDSYIDDGASLEEFETPKSKRGSGGRKRGRDSRKDGRGGPKTTGLADEDDPYTSEEELKDKDAE